MDVAVVSDYISDLLVEYLSEYYQVEQLDELNTLDGTAGASAFTQGFEIAIELSTDRRFQLTITDPFDREYSTDFTDVGLGNYTDLDDNLLDVAIDYLVEDRGLVFDLEAVEAEEVDF